MTLDLVKMARGAGQRSGIRATMLSIMRMRMGINSSTRLLVSASTHHAGHHSPNHKGTRIYIEQSIICFLPDLSFRDS
jgi:hypothetical protein